MRVSFIFLTIILFFNSCGMINKEEKKEENTTNIINKVPEGEDAELKDKPTFGEAKCDGEPGCIKGFISHGMKITMTPDATGSTDVNGDNLTLKTYSFRDSQDWADRFDTAYLKPLVPVDELKNYDFKIVPLVKRDNFSANFELYSEGLSAQDDRVKMEGEGIFISTTPNLMNCAL